MKRFILISILVFFAFLVPSKEIAFAEGGIAWPESMPISEASEDQVNIRMVSDGFGGAIIVWQDYRNMTTAPDIYAQRINENGEPLWNPTNGVIVSTAPNSQRKPVVVSDGYGGAFIAWEGFWSGNPTIYAVRISSDTGGIHPDWSWGSEEKLRIAVGYEQLSPEIVEAEFSGVNGAVIVWEEKGGGSYKICAQAIKGDGFYQWGLGTGVIVSSGTAPKEYPKIINDRQDHVIITWQDYRNNNYDIFAQRVVLNSTGTIPAPWDQNGEPVSDVTTSDQVIPEIVADGSGGAIITWIDYRNGNGDIYAQRISSTGTPVAGWTPDGVPICKEINEQYNPVMVENVVGATIMGAIIMWVDMRDPVTGPDIYAEGVDSDDPPVLDKEDIFIAVEPGPQLFPRLVSDNQGGAIGTSIDNGSKIFAQKRGQDGQPVWSSYPGVLVCEGTDIWDSQIISDGYGGAIVAWVALGSGGDFDIFAQRVTDDTVTVFAPISGRVTLSDGEEPIAGVEVEALKNGELVSSDFTDTDGYYEITDLALGITYEVRATWMYNDIESSVSMKAFAPSYYFDFTLEIDYELGTIAGNVSGVEEKYVASLCRPESKRISGSGLQKILSPGSGIAFVELEQRDKVIVRVPVEMDGNYSIPNLLPGRFIARAYNGTIYSNPRMVNLKEGETFKVNFVFSTIPKETVFNYPNPAKKGSTTIRYYCGYSDPEAEIKIYNIAGELVRGVRDSEINRDGTDPRIYRFLWDCKNDSGKEVASSIYIYIVEVKEKSSGETKKVRKRMAVIR